MRFKLQPEKIDFGNTLVENIFINDYMPLAEGNAVKVYLLGYKYALDKETTFSNETIAKNLGMTLIDVESAWVYWQEQGVVKLYDYPGDNYQIEFVNLKQHYVENIYRHMPKPVTSPAQDKPDFDDLIDANKSQAFRDMFRDIELVIGRLLTVNEKRNLLDWITKYGATPEIVVETFKYTYEKKQIKNMRYVESMLAGWHDHNIHDTDSLNDYLENKRKNYKYYNMVRKQLGFTHRQLTQGEKEIIDQWVDQWHFPMDVIEHALSFSTKTTSPNLNYFHAILENWQKKGAFTLEAIQHLKKTPSKPRKTSKTHHNFDQQYTKMSEEELENLARKNHYETIDDKEGRK